MIVRTFGFSGMVCLAIAALAGATAANAFHLSTHRTILMEALNRTGVTVNGEKLTFHVDSVTKIDEENGALDRRETLDNLLGMDGDPTWHFDDEKIAESNKRLVDLRKSIIEKLAEGKLDSARGQLGRATHLIADFYSHTNWIELGKSQPNAELGLKDLTTPLAAANEPTCAADGASLSGVGLSKLTSGYYAGIKTCTVPAGKCRHGGPAACRAGISKDATETTNHAKAVELATAAVGAFVAGVLQETAAAGKMSTVKQLLKAPSP